MGTPWTHSDRPFSGIEDLRPGDHLCVIYRDDDEHRIVLSDYLRRGLEAGERVVYIVDARTARQIRGYLRDVGINVRDAERGGQLLFLTRDDAYTREGVFDPHRMISLLRQETQQALDEGFVGLRVTGEMTWALRGLPGSERLIEYETLLNEFFPGSPCIGLCQYDARRFPADILLDVLRTHPIAVVGTRIYANVYYIPPEELQAGKSDQSTLDRWLLTLEENQRLTDGLRERTRALEERVKELECLKRVRELATRDELPLPEMLEASLDLIRSGWRWPDRAAVRIEFEGTIYASGGGGGGPRLRGGRRRPFGATASRWAWWKLPTPIPLLIQIRSCLKNRSFWMRSPIGSAARSNSDTAGRGFSISTQCCGRSAT